MDRRFLFFFLISFLTGNSMAAEQQIIYGYIEKATLLDKNLTLSAKLDTGAKSASLNATDIQQVEEQGVTYLHFKVPYKGKYIAFKSRYIGRVNIKVRTEEKIVTKNTVKRPLVLLDIKIGDKIRAIPVNLTNRKQFNYPLLLGRDAIIAFQGLVDPNHVFLVKSQAINS